MRQIILLIILCLALPALAWGPSARFERYLWQDNLAQQKVTTVLQDKQGFIWVGTFDGLARFDGYTFKHFRHDASNPFSLSNNHVKTILEDASGYLWIGTQGGLNRLDTTTEQFTHYVHDATNNSISNNQVSTLLEDQQGNLWIGTLGGGLNQFNPLSNQFSHYRHDDQNQQSLSDDHVYALSESVEGILWVGTAKGGLNQFKPDTGQFVQYSHQPDNPYSLSNDTILDIYQDHQGIMWLGTQGGGLNRFDAQSGQFIHYRHDPANPSSLSGDIVNTINQDIHGNLWVGTRQGGLNRFEAKNSTFTRFTNNPTQSNSLSDNSVLAIFSDNQSNLWIGTNKGGLNRLNHQMAAFNHYRPTIYNDINQTSLSHTMVSAFAEDQHGNIWVGTQGGGLNRIDAKTGHFSHFRHSQADTNSLSNDTITALAFDHQGNLWIGTQNSGLDYFDTVKQTFTHFRHNQNNPQSLSDDSISALKIDRKGALWIGTFAEGLSRFEPLSRQFSHHRFDALQLNSISSNKITAISEDHKGNLWIGTIKDGLNYFDVSSQKFTRYRHKIDVPNSLNNDTIKAITVDYAGNVWIGTVEGLNLFNPATNKVVFEHFSSAEGLAGNTIKGIVEDHQGFIWVSTNQGLSKWDPETSVFTNYSAQDGLQSSTFISGAAFISQQGEVFFGGNNGFNRFFPRLIVDDSVEPTVVLTDMLLLNKSVELSWTANPQTKFSLEKTINATRHLTLDQSQNLVSFEFAALHYSQPKQNHYAYRLEHWDKSWITTKSTHRRATYTNLPAGNYVLHVKAANPSGVWNNQGKRLKITVLGQPWNTWWAYLIYALLVFAALYFFVGSQRKNVVHERALNRQFKQVNRLKDEFLAITSYELRTPIHGIIGLAESLIDGVAGRLPLKAQRELAMVVASGRRLTNQINDIVDFSNLKNHNIELSTRPVELHSLCDVVLMLSRPLLGDKTLALVNEVSDDLPAVLADEERLHQIIYNLVDNAIKFTDVGQIVISAFNQGEQLKINISDTGVGIAPEKLSSIFETFEQVNSNTAHAFGGTGLGLFVSKQLVELHGGNIEVRSSVGWGTTFSFTLPSSLAQAEETQYRQKMVERLHLLETQEKVHNSPPINKTPEGQSQPFRILLVDDEPVNLQVLHNYLSKKDYELVEAAGGQHALYEIAKSEPFDMVLLDLLMPRLSGFEVCKKIRALYPMNDLPVIFLTANIDVNNLVQCFKVGGNDYLNKPVNKYELLTRVETHLKLLDINRNLERKVAERTAALENSNQHIGALSRICNEISATLDLDKLLVTVYYRMKELMDVKVLCIGHYEPHEQRIVFRQGIESEMYLNEYYDAMSEKNLPSVWCVENQKPVIINDYAKDFARYFGDLPTPVTKLGVQPKSLVYWPLIVKERIIGVLSVQSLHKNVFNKPQQDIIRTLASTTAIALDNAKAYHEIEAQKEAVEQKNEEIVETQQRLVQAEKMASLGTLTAGVAHEINNPTNFVHVSTQNLSNDIAICQKFILDLAGSDTDKQVLNSINRKFAPLHEHLSTITEGTGRIMAIVKDLGAFTHLDSADKEPVRIVERLQSTIHLIQVEYAQRAEFITDFHGNPTLVCHPGKLNQVFMNLIVNACDAIRDKQRQEDIPTKGQIVIGCRQIDKMIAITISDNGCGMESKTKSKLFEPFYTTKKVGEGTGLGLSISFGIVQWHGGTIEVESTPGVGSTFSVLLPIT